MSKKKKIILIIVLIIALLAVGVLAFCYFRKDTPSTTKKAANEDVIKGYDYTIKKTDSKLKKEKFKELKKILSLKEINYDDYASKLAEIFAVDVYDLDSKFSKYDVGGLEYVITDKKEEFKLLLQDTLYSNVKDNNDNDRKQELPKVVKATKEDLENGTYNYQEEEYDSYDVKIKIDYDKDLGYDNNVLIKMIKKENKLYIVVVEPY